MTPLPSANKFCPNCGTPILPGSLAGLCPQCLMNAGLESGQGFDPQVAATLAGYQAPQPTPPGGFVPPEISELAARFPQLEILELLGKGGMGAVYKARQRGLDRLVALKILPPEIGNDLAFAERFTREARALGKLNHPNIVSVYDFGRTSDSAGGLYYFLMEYVEGANLRQAIRSGGMSPKEALAIIPQICDALQFAHDEGIVHRDIKPENILIDKRGRVKIADFGLAKLLGADQADHSLTGTNQVMGTLRYMAPEQMLGAKEIDHRADIFSLGVVFYELLTGELPVGRFAPPSKTVGVDVRLDEVVLRALEREPTLRYQQASEVKTQVQHIAGLSPEAVRNIFGWEYRSQTEIFGWPLLHVAFGIDHRTGKRRIAKGVVAIGDAAVGGLAIGGTSCGIFACGGLSIGMFSLGGCSLGLLLAVGGLAIGSLAFGGLAIGAVAIGGGAVGYYAYGGGGFGRYVMTGDRRDPIAEQFLNRWAMHWPAWTVVLAIGVPLLNVLVFLFVGLVHWFSQGPRRLPQAGAVPDKAAPPALDDTRQQIKNVGSLLIALGVMTLLASLVVGISVSVVANKFAANWLQPLIGGLAASSFLAGIIEIKAGMNLLRCEHLGFGLVGVVLGMIPITPVALLGIPLGLWAWSILTRREATLVAEEGKQLREKEIIAARARLQDQESMWYDLGYIAGYFLRDPTTRWIIGGLASLVYLACLVLFFSFHGERVMVGDVETQRFSAGQPGPWFLVEASTQGHHWSIQFVSWANVVALVGVGALQVARQIERLQTGKMHSMAWHYVIWGFMLAIVCGLGVTNLIVPAPPQARPPAESPVDAHGGRPLPRPEIRQAEQE